MFLIYNYFMHILTLSVSDKMVFIVLLYKLLKVEYTGYLKTGKHETFLSYKNLKNLKHTSLFEKVWSVINEWESELIIEWGIDVKLNVVVIYNMI